MSVASEADDIKADFLAEAGELTARLGEQLVGLEQRPTDRELLNAVFRGFHTIKGGAGFLALQPMVTLCHAAEDVFNALRNGSAMHAGLMDAVMESLDRLQQMLDAVAAGRAPPAAPAALIERLRGGPASAAAAAEPVAVEASPLVPESSSATISDDEFEA